jgi:tetratricopeptide (TPR) repeat protein
MKAGFGPLSFAQSKKYAWRTLPKGARAGMPTHPDLQRSIDAMRSGRLADAETLLSGFLAREPGNVQANWLMLQTLESLQKRDEALETLQKLLIHVRKDLASIDRIASHCLQRRYPLEHVLLAYEKYLAYRPTSANAVFNYAYYQARDARFEAAIRTYLRALKLGIDNPEEVHLNIANICMDHLQDHDRAKQHLHEALALNPAYGSAYHNLGNLAEQEGEREEAARCFEKCLDLDPANESALARLADTHRFEAQDDPLLARLDSAAANSRDCDLLFAAGRAHEQLREYDTAWEYFKRSNELDKLARPVYRRRSTEAAFDRIAGTCNHNWIGRFAGQSHDAVFICGMFRTGSTLLEQILAAHPRFQAGGENQFFPRLVAREFPGYPGGLEALKDESVRIWRQRHLEHSRKIFGGSLRVTDKRPDNFLYIGLIKAVLPAAKFVVTERDWRDIATSIYSVRLGITQTYATDLRSIRHYVSKQNELVEHWASLLGPDLIRVRYEDLVQQTRETVSGVLDWLGEDWDERCLSFHTLRNSVKTASVWQVREPMHTNSVGRWRNYEKHFKQVFGEELDT